MKKTPLTKDVLWLVCALLVFLFISDAHVQRPVEPWINVHQNKVASTMASDARPKLLSEDDMDQFENMIHRKEKHQSHTSEVCVL